jgi:hypothetical protein
VGQRTPSGSPPPAPTAAATTSVPGGKTAVATASGQTLRRKSSRPQRTRTSHSSQGDGGPGVQAELAILSAEKPSPAATTSAPTVASTYPPTPHQRAPAAPKRTGRSSLPPSPRPPQNMSTALAACGVLGNPLARLSARGRPGRGWPVRGATTARTEDRMLHPGWAAAIRLPRHGWRTPPPQSWRMVSTPRSWRKKRDASPRRGRPRLASPSAPARMTKILEAEGGAKAAARLASPHHQTGGHRLGRPSARGCSRAARRKSLKPSDGSKVPISTRPRSSNDSKSKATWALPIRGLGRRKGATHEGSVKAWLPPRRSTPF